MRKNSFIYLVTLCFLASGFVSCNKCCAKEAKLQNELDSINYAFGVINGEQIKTYYLQGDTTEANIKALIKGINDAVKKQDETMRFYALGLNVGSGMASQTKQGLMGDSTLTANIKLIQQALIEALSGKETKLSGDEAMEFLNTIMEKQQAKKAEAEFGENKVAGETFLAENAKRENVVVTESGLQYEVLVAGKGEKPAATDKVKVHYKGTLIDGTVFDSSYDRNKPAEFGVTQVIKGWTEALQLMSVGSKWKLYIPYELAYGSQNQGKIKPFSALIFEVELLGIEK
ncbi:MAG: FKBP-type peptidyl-prolyl cis-trans isomerase [Paludibacteraceae bacterium]|nr:FKBP-type peptidyl-prolyl cis-trans isomerase [Paludibacteraceae bacterium]